MRFGRLAVLLVSLGVACAPGTTPPSVTPADLTTLEARTAAHPDDPAAQVGLAKASYAAERFTDARRALALVLGAEPQDREAQA